MKTCVVLGGNSDIYKGLRPYLEKDYEIHTWVRDQEIGIGDTLWTLNWDLLISCIGSIAPVGLWHDLEPDDWHGCFHDNLHLPFQLLYELWPCHNPGASICMMAGSNPNMIMDGYSAYNVSKMALLKLVEQLDHETPDAKFFALGPGTILTKIHKPSLEADWNNPKLYKAIAENKEADYKRLYECLSWCVAQEKAVVGGRNICASDPWEDPFTVSWTMRNRDLFKLRRHEGY